MNIETVTKLNQFSSEHFMTNRYITTIDKVIAENLSTARKECNLPRRVIIEELNISQQQLWKYENAVNRVPASRLYRFSEVYNKPIQYFYNIQQ